MNFIEVDHRPSPGAVKTAVKAGCICSEHSLRHQRRYGDFEAPIFDLHALPPVTKSELMANFDDWVIDGAFEVSHPERRLGAGQAIANGTRIGKGLAHQLQHHSHGLS
jgi:hypothetical protein